VRGEIPSTLRGGVQGEGGCEGRIIDYIIDGNNLIKSSFLREIEDSRSTEQARDSLFNLLLDYKKKHPSFSFFVVFDGFPPSPGIYLKDRKIKILFSGEITADEKIRHILEKDPAGNRFRTVVSDDREVLDTGRLLGTKTLNIIGFIQLICPPPTDKKTASTNNKQDINRLAIEKELRDYYKTR